MEERTHATHHGWRLARALVGGVLVMIGLFTRWAAFLPAQGTNTQRRSSLPRGMAFLTLLILARRVLPQPLETPPRVISFRVALAAFLAMRRAACEWLRASRSSSRREDPSAGVRLPPSLT